MSILIFVVLSAVAAAFCYLKFFRKIARIRAEIWEAPTYLTTLPDGKNDEQKEAIDIRLQKYAAVKEIWRDFERSLVVRTAGDGTKKYRSNTNAATFFSFERFTQDFNLPLWQLYGNVYIFLAIFAALYAVLPFVTGAQVLSDEFFGVLAQGFAALVLGLVFAVACGFVVAERLRALQRDVRELSELADKLFPRQTEEQTLAERYDLSQEQAEALQRIGDNVAEALVSVMERKLDEQMEPTFDKMTATIDRLSQGGTDKIADVLSLRASGQIESLTSFLRTVKSDISSQIAEAKHIPMDVNAKLLNNALQMSDLLNRNDEKNAARQQKNIVALQNTVLDALADNRERLVGSVESATSTSRRESERVLNETREMLHSLSEKIDRETQNLDGLRRFLQETTEQTNEQIKFGIADVTEQNRLLSETAVSAMKSTSAALNAELAAEVNANLGDISDAVAGALKLLSETRRESVRKSLRNIEAAFSAIKSISPTLVERMAAVESASSALKSLSERSAEASLAVSQAAAPIAQAAERLTEIADSLADKFDKTQRANRKQLKDIADRLKQISVEGGKSDDETGGKNDGKKSKTK